MQYLQNWSNISKDTMLGLIFYVLQNYKLKKYAIKEYFYNHSYLGNKKWIRKITTKNSKEKQLKSVIIFT